jgi:hypothetical protein
MGVSGQRHISNNTRTSNEKVKIEKNKSIQGKHRYHLLHNHIDNEARNKWLDQYTLYGETEEFIITIQDQVIRTKNYLLV